MGHRSGDGVGRPRLRARAATPPCRAPTRARQGLPRGIRAVALRPGIRRQCNHHGVTRHRKDLVQGSPLQKDRDRSVAGHRLKSRATRCTGPRHTQCSSRPSYAPHPCCPLSSASYSTEKSTPASSAESIRRSAAFMLASRRSPRKACGELAMYRITSGRWPPGAPAVPPGCVRFQPRSMRRRLASRGRPGHRDRLPPGRDPGGDRGIGTPTHAPGRRGLEAVRAARPRCE